MTSLLSDIIVVIMIILLFTLTCPALFAPPDHHVPDQDLRNKIPGKSAPAPPLEHAAPFASSDVRFKTAPEKTNDSSRSGNPSMLLISPRPPDPHL